MSDPLEKAESKTGPGRRSFPPGRTKITEALKSLLAEKEFAAITTAELARTAGVTEGLIYKYFEDKRDLLHKVLAEYLEDCMAQMEQDLKGIKGALNKLRKLIWSHLNMYAGNRVFGKILLLEVRNFPDYFKSDAYQMVRLYTDTIVSIIEEGVAAGEIRPDIPPKVIRQVLLGAIEHVCLPGVIFGRDIFPDELTEQLCELIFDGIATPGRG